MAERIAKSSVLIVDSDAECRAALHGWLVDHDYEVRVAGTIAGACTSLERSPVDILFADFSLPDGTGPDLIRWSLGRNRALGAYCLLADSTCRNVVEAMRAGATDVLEKPFEIGRLAGLLTPRTVDDGTELREWRARYAPGLLGEDARLLEVLAMLREVADTHCTVLVTGESGTGKELVARALHQASRRCERSLIAVNCGAIPETLIEAELFGHTRGAFTGAVSAREGRLVAADGGTLFLDEIGDMPLTAQAKLLRVLQDQSVTPVGADRPCTIDIRIVAATNKDLEAMVRAGTFRADLYFRLSVIRVELPPLRERIDDILSLAKHFLALVNRTTLRSVHGFDAGAEEALRDHPWPGNIRELSNVVERAVVLKREGRLSARDLRIPLRQRELTPPLAGAALPALANGSANLNLRSALDNVERQLIEQALERTGGNRTEAAALLGLNRTTLVEKIRKFAE